MPSPRSADPSGIRRSRGSRELRELANSSNTEHPERSEEQVQVQVQVQSLTPLAPPDPRSSSLRASTTTLFQSSHTIPAEEEHVTSAIARLRRDLSEEDGHVHLQPLTLPSTLVVERERDAGRKVDRSSYVSDATSTTSSQLARAMQVVHSERVGTGMKAVENVTEDVAASPGEYPVAEEHSNSDDDHSESPGSRPPSYVFAQTPPSHQHTPTTLSPPPSPSRTTPSHPSPPPSLTLPSPPTLSPLPLTRALSTSTELLHLRSENASLHRHVTHLTSELRSKAGLDKRVAQVRKQVQMLEGRVRSGASVCGSPVSAVSVHTEGCERCREGEVERVRERSERLEMKMGSMVQEHQRLERARKETIAKLETRIRELEREQRQVIPPPPGEYHDTEDDEARYHPDVSVCANCAGTGLTQEELDELHREVEESMLEKVAYQNAIAHLEAQLQHASNFKPELQDLTHKLAECEHMVDELQRENQVLRQGREEGERMIRGKEAEVKDLTKMLEDSIREGEGWMKTCQAISAHLNESRAVSEEAMALYEQSISRIQALEADVTKARRARDTPKVEAAVQVSEWDVMEKGSDMDADPSTPDSGVDVADRPCWEPSFVVTSETRCRLSEMGTRVRRLVGREGEGAMRLLAEELGRGHELVCGILDMPSVTQLRKKKERRDRKTRASTGMDMQTTERRRRRPSQPELGRADGKAAGFGSISGPPRSCGSVSMPIKDAVSRRSAADVTDMRVSRLTDAPHPPRTVSRRSIPPQLAPLRSSTISRNSVHSTHSVHSVTSIMSSSSGKSLRTPPKLPSIPLPPTPVSPEPQHGPGRPASSMRIRFVQSPMEMAPRALTWSARKRTSTMGAVRVGAVSVGATPAGVNVVSRPGSPPSYPDGQSANGGDAMKELDRLSKELGADVLEKYDRQRRAVKTSSMGSS